jgi:hypothetical protein
MILSAGLLIAKATCSIFVITVLAQTPSNIEGD